MGLTYTSQKEALHIHPEVDIIWLQPEGGDCQPDVEAPEIHSCEKLWRFWTPFVHFLDFGKMQSQLCRRDYQT